MTTDKWQRISKEVAMKQSFPEGAEEHKNCVKIAAYQQTYELTTFQMQVLNDTATLTCSRYSLVTRL
jgi:hypothetical protein